MDREVNRLLASKVEITNGSTEKTFPPTMLFYRNQMNSNYKQDETKLRKIISNHVDSETESPMKHMIFYRIRKMSSLLIKNIANNSSSKSRVVCRYTCPETECQHSQFYIGYTTTTLKQRMTTHAKNGSILAQEDKNWTDPEKRVRVIYKSPDKIEHILAETLLT